MSQPISPVSDLATPRTESVTDRSTDSPDPGDPSPGGTRAPPAPKRERFGWLIFVLPFVAIFFPLLLRRACGN